MKIVLATHGELANGLIDSYQMIAGRADNITVVSLKDDGIKNFTDKLRLVLDDLIVSEEVLIMCDLRGGTPYNESLKYQLENPEKVDIVTGVNLPMLMEVGLSGEADLNSIKNLAISVGIDSIQDFEEEGVEDDYDLDF